MLNLSIRLRCLCRYFDLKRVSHRCDGDLGFQETALSKTIINGQRRGEEGQLLGRYRSTGLYWRKRFSMAGQFQVFIPGGWKIRPESTGEIRLGALLCISIEA